MINEWQIIIIFLSIASMVFGAVAAIGQKNLKRLIAYSSIGHMGYALAGLSVGSNQGIQSAISYISIYLIMNLAFFSCLFMIRKNENYFENIEDLAGLSKNHPILSISLMIVLFSLAGIPPLAGFFAKFYIFMAVIEQSMYFLAVIGLLSTVIAAYYYLRVVWFMYFENSDQAIGNNGISNAQSITSIIVSAMLLLIGLYPNPIIEYTRSIISSFLLID